MKKILLTGASGFVGSNLARFYLDLGYELHILTRKESNLWRLKDVYSKIHDHKVDLLDAKLLNSIVKEIEPDFIVHNAIYGGRPNQSEAQKVIDVNFQGSKNLVDACTDVDFECFINTGSSSEYGVKSEPMKETDICEPVNIYGIAKLSATLYCNYVAKQTGKNIGTLRLFSPFGDYEDQGRLFTDLALNCCLGSDVKLANPNAVRDFIYIKDVLDLYYKVMQQPSQLKAEIYNVAYGKQHSVSYMAEKVKSLMSSKSNLCYGELSGRAADTTTWQADITKTKNTFNWQPNLDFDNTIKDASNWFMQNKGLYNL